MNATEALKLTPGTRVIWTDETLGTVHLVCPTEIGIIWDDDKSPIWYNPDDCQKIEREVWRLQRISGRRGDEWHNMYEGDSAEKARAIWKKEFENLRQGGIRLMHGNVIMLDAEIPCLHTRW